MMAIGLFSLVENEMGFVRIYKYYANTGELCLDNLVGDVEER